MSGIQQFMLCVFQRCIYLLARLCIAYTELMNVYNKKFFLVFYTLRSEWEIPMCDVAQFQRGSVCFFKCQT